MRKVEYEDEVVEVYPSKRKALERGLEILKENPRARIKVSVSKYGNHVTLPRK